MVLADPEDFEPQLVGELDLLEQLLQPARRMRRIRAKRQVGEGGETQFHCMRGYRHRDVSSETTL